MIRRFNHKDLPKEMEECVDGYWVTFEDYNLSELTHNKEIEKTYNRFSEEIQKYQYLKSENKTVDNLRTAVIIMSAIIFGGLMAFLFTWI
ncbi:hypothetical protein UFOVP1655_55 [uncultured Caudovirales phage]|uniref:Uncharacterized protein n=1 Tax=uncultured Caudovirales phage TaxID=2100421 RepID=A0A6J5T3I7_9CAUD|nr:hypothetical protein UFOVP1655_55 [uncultured Caudovirales phage]